MIAKLVKGTGFRGALEYDLREQKGLLLDTNTGGSTPQGLAKEFGEIRALRPNLTKAVCHVSISLSPNEKLTDAQWKDVAQSYLTGMGFQDSQYVVSKHTDTEHPHIHIIANRITIKGEVVSDSHDYQRQESIMRKLEQEYGLTRVAPSKESSRKALSKGEVEHALRTGEASIRTRLQELVDYAMKGNPSFEMFTMRLAQNAVQTKLNEASTGKVNGISFSLEGVAMKGSSLGKAYTWNSLIKRGLTYEQDRSGKEYEYNTTPTIRDNTAGFGSAQSQIGYSTATIGGVGSKVRGLVGSYEEIELECQLRSKDRDRVRQRSQGVSR